MSKLQVLIGKIKNKPCEDWKGMDGVTFLLMGTPFDERFLVIRPIGLDEMERFYKSSYDDGLKDAISSNYDYCIYYLLDECWELTCYISRDQLEEIREATEEDLKRHDSNLEEFKKIHKVYEYIQKLKDEEQIALNEFEKVEKIKFPVAVKGNKKIEVDAVIYKGFAIHDHVCSMPGVQKVISITEGKHKGLALFYCNVTEYKKAIDEIRATIGNVEVTEENAKDLIRIIKNY